MRARLSRQICDQHTTPDRPSVVHRADRQVGADLCRIDRRPGLTALITLVRERFEEAAKIGRGASAGDLGRRAARVVERVPAQNPVLSPADGARRRTVGRIGRI